MEAQTKQDEIKIHLLRYKKISSWEAVNLYNQLRLAAVVHSLKKQGFDIQSEEKRGLDAKKRPVRWTEYILVSEPNKSALQGNYEIKRLSSQPLVQTQIFI
jgi:hypothetical protein